MTNNKTEGVEQAEIIQEFKEINYYLTAIYKDGKSMQTWIEFSDKLNAFERKLVAFTQPSPPAGVEQRAKELTTNMQIKIGRLEVNCFDEDSEMSIRVGNSRYQSLNVDEAKELSHFIHSHIIHETEANPSDETQSIAGSESQGREAGWVRNAYADWCNKTKRNGSVLVGGSIYEFFDWLEKH